MEKENGEQSKSTPSDANHMVDPLAMFAGHNMFSGGLAGSYGHHLTSAYNALLAGGGRAGQTPGYPLPPTTSSYASLGTLSVAASQAASLGINSANAAWWTMASHLAAQDYLARLQASGLQFPLAPDMPGFPLMPTAHSQGGSGGGSNSKSQSGLNKTSGGHLIHSGTSPSHHRDSSSTKGHNLDNTGRMKHGSSISVPKSMMSHPGVPNAMLSESGSAGGSGSLLGGVRLPPDTEIIKYTSSIVGPKVPGTTNRGRKKTISLDPPAVSMLASQPIPPQRKLVDERPTSLSVSTSSPRPFSLESEHSELSELIKLSNGQLTPQASPVPPGYHTPPARAVTPGAPTAAPAIDCDAPLNLSLKPAPPSPASNSALQSLSSLSQSLGQMPDKISRRKPGPKPRRVSQSPLPPPPSPSLAQLFAAADSPRPTPSINASTDDAEPMALSHHKDGRPRNLGRGVSKPKKNTVASLLAQSRALGIKSSLDMTSPLNHQVSLLKANILQQQMANAAKEGALDLESDDKKSSTAPNIVEELQERSKKLHQQRGLEELRALMQESQSETSSVPDTNSLDSDSDKDSTVSSKKREGDPLPGGPPKKRKIPDNALEDFYMEFRVPLQKGWRRETIIEDFNKSVKARTMIGDVLYYSPEGSSFKQMTDLVEYLEKNQVSDLNKSQFSFEPSVLVGDFIVSNNLGDAPERYTGREMMNKVTIKMFNYYNSLCSGLALSRKGSELYVKPDKDPSKELKKSEAARNKELTRFLKEEERTAKQEAIKKEREQKNMQALEARRKRQEEVEKIRSLKLEDQLRKQQERELKKQQSAMIREQELAKQREVLYSVELERERRRQHMTMVKQLEVRKRQEEREKKRLEVKAEKLATREKRLEQRRIDLDLLEEIRKPIEDMELPDLKSLPDLKRIHGLKLSGTAFSDILMVFEFLHTFGETLGFDMGSLPTLNSLQNALLGDEEAEEELLSVMTHMVICAIEDPGIPNPARHTTLLGQSLKQADITHANLSEILRIYLYANATGEVKALAGVQFEREREKRLSDHHNNLIEGQGDDAEGGKNAAFFVALRENSTWRMSELLRQKPFLALNPTQKAKILQFLCHELLQNKAVIRQIENAIETVAQLKRDRYTNESKLRKLRHMHNRKVRQMAVGDDDPPPSQTKDHEDDEDNENESDNESDGTQPEEEEDKKLSIEEMARKLEKLNKQAEQTLTSLADSEGQLRGTCYGQDRYFRRYWKFPTTGGLFVEAMESAEPDLFQDFLQRDDADSMETPDIKGEYEAEHRLMKPLDDNGDEDDDEMPHLTPEVDTETYVSKYKQEHNDMDDEPAELPCISQDKENIVKNESMKEETEDTIKNEFSGGEEDCETKSVFDDKKSQTFQLFQEKGDEESNITNGQTEGETELEVAWFNVLPREPCDNTSITAVTSAFRCGTENSELRIPVFPPPPPASPSLSQCDSPGPAPLSLSAEESAQLEHCKMYGLPTPAPAKPIPYDLRCGWWRITEAAVVQKIVENLHTRGAREKDLRRNILRPSVALGQNWASTLKKCVAEGEPGSELGTWSDSESVLLDKAPARDRDDDWNYGVALRVDISVLELVEALEDKVANASMQIKGWKVPPKASLEEGRGFEPSCSHPSPQQNPIYVAKTRLIDLESYIERRYLKPPLGVNMGGVEGSLNVAVDTDTVPKGLIIWREAVAKSQTAAQLSMGLHMLEASIAWDKSIMKANCQFCHSGDNEDKLLLCDGCDKGYHTYCFKPKMDNIPEGDWYCYECMNKATGDKNCIVCGKKLGRNLVICDNCPKAYHTDCLQPPLSKLPRGKWHCPACLAKMPRKRVNAKRTISTSPCSSASRDDNPPATLEPTTTHVPSPLPAEDIAPESPPPPLTPVKKEKSSGKKMAKEMAPCRQLLEELETHDEAWPFLLPVNTKQFPTYKKIIKNPMDLGTIRKRLQDSVYKCREDFAADVRLIFNNCETFNEDDSPVGKAGHHMRFFFETRWSDLMKAPC